MRGRPSEHALEQRARKAARRAGLEVHKTHAGLALFDRERNEVVELSLTARKVLLFCKARMSDRRRPSSTNSRVTSQRPKAIAP